VFFLKLHQERKIRASSKAVFFTGENLPKSEIKIFLNRQKKKSDQRLVRYFWFIAIFD
jgi:hypothetical protein